MDIAGFDYAALPSFQVQEQENTDAFAFGPLL